MIELLEEKIGYLNDFERLEGELANVGPPWLHSIRRDSMEHFAAQGFPTIDDEDWRFTNMAAVTKIPFEIGEHDGIHFEADKLPKGVVVCKLADAFRKCPDVLEQYLTKLGTCTDSAFTFLNAAFIMNGFFVYVPRNVAVEQPIHLRFTAPKTERPTCWQRRVLIVAEENSQVRIHESYDGQADTVYFTNVVTEIALGKNTVVDHYKVQRESRKAYHVSTTQISLAATANFASQSIGLGGALVRNDINADLDGEHCECTLNGLYVSTTGQHIDNHTFIDHAVPNCQSHELYKGILDGKGRGVFNGKILVRQDAQKTDAKQTNQTLLLSEDAVINTQPQLEIFADDVKCTHGATVGQLDDDMMFYLRSRGIDRQTARAILTYAFAVDILGRIKIDALRHQLENEFLAMQHLVMDDRTEVGS